MIRHVVKPDRIVDLGTGVLRTEARTCILSVVEGVPKTLVAAAGGCAVVAVEVHAAEGSVEACAGAAEIDVVAAASAWTALAGYSRSAGPGWDMDIRALVEPAVAQSSDAMGNALPLEA